METTFKLLVAYDGSDCAEAALDDLRRAGLPSDGVEALVLTVADVVMLPPPPSSYELVESVMAAEAEAVDQRRYAKNVQALEEARRLSGRAAERLRRNFPGWLVRDEAVNGSPAWEVVAKADEWRPDLIVVGSHGRSALGRLIMGSVSQRVLTEARCSVRVSRGRIEVDGAGPARLLVGVDGSRGSEAAVRAVAARSWPTGTEVRVVTAEEPLLPYAVGGFSAALMSWAGEPDVAASDLFSKITEGAAEKLRQAGLSATPAVVEGDPRRVLVEEAARWGADCIHVGWAGFSNRIERFLIGSVAAAIAARAGCSVEVARAETNIESADGTD